MSVFKVRFDLQVRFRDTDAMGHVNNAVYLSYFELARVVYWERFAGRRDVKDIPFILVRAEVEFKAPMLLGSRAEIGVRASRLGRSSWDFEYEIAEKDTGRVFATGKTVQCCFDYAKQKVMRMPAEMRTRIADFDELLLEA